jgi:hypothetical protein
MTTSDDVVGDINSVANSATEKFEQRSLRKIVRGLYSYFFVSPPLIPFLSFIVILLIFFALFANP